MTFSHVKSETGVRPKWLYAAVFLYLGRLRSRLRAISPANNASSLRLAALSTMQLNTGHLWIHYPKGKTDAVALRGNAAADENKQPGYRAYPTVMLVQYGIWLLRMC